MKFILKGLIQRDDSAGKSYQTLILKKQMKALNLKQEPSEQAASETVMIDTASVASKSRVTPPSPLAEIFSLIKSDCFKQDKALMRNLSLLIQQILKQFDIAREELELANQQISSETISSFAEVLSLESLDQQLMEDLGDFFY